MAMIRLLCFFYIDIKAQYQLLQHNKIHVEVIAGDHNCPVAFKPLRGHQQHQLIDTI